MDNSHDILMSLESQYCLLFKEVINEFYGEKYAENKDAYPLYDVENYDVLFLVDDYHLLNYQIYIIIFLKKEEKRETEIIKVSDLFSKEEVAEITDDYKIIDNIQEAKGFGDKIFYYPFRDLKEAAAPVSDSIYLKKFIRIQINRYKEKYHELMNKTNRELSKIEYSERYQYTRYDVQGILDYFEESDQLATLFEQTMFCYEHSKFLASAACAGVIIEEICVLILEKEGVGDNNKSKNTSIVELAGLLKNKNIITKKVAGRLNAASVIRNSVSHTSSGYASAIDTDLLIQTAKTLFESYMTYLNK